MTAIDLLFGLTDASVSVGILVLLVLIIRKPFAYYFGPQAVYLLWLAPALRLMLPELAILPPPQNDAYILTEAPTISITAQTSQEDPSSFGYTFLLTSAFYLWIVVAFGWLNVLFAAQRKFQRQMLEHSTRAPVTLVQQANHIAESLGYQKTLQLRILDSNDGPMTVGALKSTVYVPANFDKDYTNKERRLALTHEIAHIARGDMIAAFFANIFKVLQWPNPLVHIAYRAFRKDQEAACDAYVMKRHNGCPEMAYSYASAIVKSARTNSIKSAHGLSLSHPIKERIMFLKKPSLSPKRSLMGAVFATALIGAGLVTTASYGYADPQKDENTKKETRIKTKKIIAVDSDQEEIFIKGIDNGKVRKIVLTNENGERQITIYDDEGNIVEEKLIGPDETMMHDTIIIKKENGETESINLNLLGHESLILTEDHHGNNEFAFCNVDGDDRHISVYAWTDDTQEGETKIVTKQAICLNGPNSDTADPKERAKALRKAISQLKKEQAKAEKFRKKTIKELEKELKKLEK